jgi:hypothetical protein
MYLKDRNRLNSSGNENDKMLGQSTVKRSRANRSRINELSNRLIHLNILITKIKRYDPFLGFNSTTHLPFHGRMDIVSKGLISSSQFPGLSGTPLQVYFKIIEDINIRSSINAILKLVWTSVKMGCYSLPRHTRGPYEKIIL